MPPTTDDHTATRIRSVLLNDWDPHNVISNEAAHGSYDHYLPPLRDLIEASAAEDAVMNWLYEREQETMCFPSAGKERLRRVARKLTAVRGE